MNLENIIINMVTNLNIKLPLNSEGAAKIDKYLKQNNGSFLYNEVILNLEHFPEKYNKEIVK